MKFLAIFLFLFSTATFSETGEEVCADISFSSDREECYAFIRGRYVDIDAGYVCIRAKFNSGKLDCIKVSADKEYTLAKLISVMRIILTMIVLIVCETVGAQQMVVELVVVF